LTLACSFAPICRHLLPAANTNPHWERLTTKRRQGPRKQFFFEKKNQKTFICFARTLLVSAALTK
jgi:hypothetical protein